jgi:hypothetical protein
MMCIKSFFFLLLILAFGGNPVTGASDTALFHSFTSIRSECGVSTAAGVIKQRVKQCAWPVAIQVDHKVYVEKNEEGELDTSSVKEISEEKQHFDSHCCRRVQFAPVAQSLRVQGPEFCYSTSRFIVLRVIRI